MEEVLRRPLAALGPVFAVVHVGGGGAPARLATALRAGLHHLACLLLVHAAPDRPSAWMRSISRSEATAVRPVATSSRRWRSFSRWASALAAVMTRSRYRPAMRSSASARVSASAWEMRSVSLALYWRIAFARATLWAASASADLIAISRYWSAASS